MDHPNLLVGTQTFDDAGVYKIADDLALVQTVDFFPPLVDDPFAFGQIAAANALSDIYAMGGDPLTAMNIVAFPDRELPAEVLHAILEGGAERVAVAGAVMVGGHSVRDAEIKYGLAVTGRVHPERIVTNAAAKPGDALVLTKPLGSGILTSAVKSGKLAPEALSEAVAVMIELNAGAKNAMTECGVRAATDITGFGLLGHAHEIAVAGGVTLEIDASAVPILARAMNMAEMGVITRAHKSNLEYIGDGLDRGGAPDLLVNVLADAQTSGGLLMCVPAGKTAELLDRLEAQKVATRCVIGRVRERGSYAIRLVEGSFSHG